MATRTLNGWIDRLQSQGRYAFRRAEALSGANMTAAAVGKALLRLTKKGRVARVKKYFYVIVPIEYACAGAPPPAWFIHDLMDAMCKPYYVGLLSAAALHGASHQQAQEFQVVTDGYVRAVQVGRIRVRFFAKRSCQATPKSPVKTPTGSMFVSTPEATAVDLIRHAKSVGYFSNVASILTEMAPMLDKQKLFEAARAEGSIMAGQRLGYILEKIGSGGITGPLAAWLKTHDLHTARLCTDRPAEYAKPHPVWRVIPNDVLEIEA